MEPNSPMHPNNSLEPRSPLTPSASGATPAIAMVASSVLREAATQAISSNIGPALRRNRAFTAAGRHESAVVFPNLRLFVITCLDPRVDLAYVLGLALS